MPTKERAAQYRFARMSRDGRRTAAWIEADLAASGSTPDGWRVDQAYSRIVMRGVETGRMRTVGWA